MKAGEVFFSMRYGCLVHGKVVESDNWYPIIDPCTGKEYARAAMADRRLVDAALASSLDAFAAWRRTPSHRRSELLHALADRIRGDREALAHMLSREVGKPLPSALKEVVGAASLIDYFAEEGLRLAGRVPLLGNSREQVMIVREPVGVVVAITPFNYPLSTLACKMGPALAAGCTVVSKPDEHTPLSTIRMGELALDAGIPAGVFNVVTGMGQETGRFLVEHPTPRMITFTGSTAVGKEIQATSARWARKVVLELGGNCPAIICADSPWRGVLADIVHQTFNNSGQYCYRISRIYAAEEIYREFLSEFAELVSRMRVGPATDEKTDLGPLNNPQVLSMVREQVERASREGATAVAVTSSAYPVEGGFYYPPTIVTGVEPGMTILKEEVFGPVVAIVPFKDIDEAIDGANATPYGLAAYLFTKEIGNALEWAGRLEMGSIWINRIHQAYPEAPFGGMKESGLGREKSSFGLEEYTELKTIYLSY